MTLTEYFNKIFEYNNGKIFWKSPRPKVKIGSEAGTITNRGYRQIRVDGKFYRAHQIVWLMHNNDLPSFLDHIDCNKLNNKIENLRAATKQENGQNTHIKKNNTSGVKGVSWLKNAKKYSARIRIKGERKYLGLFDCLEDAKNAIVEFRNVNHKEFARHE